MKQRKPSSNVKNKGDVKGRGIERLTRFKNVPSFCRREEDVLKAIPQKDGRNICWANFSSINYLCTLNPEARNNEGRIANIC